MSFLFDIALRERLTAALASFVRAEDTRADDPLKHAAVAITVVGAADGSGAAEFLLTRRASSLRAHGGQWALPGGRCDPGETATAAAVRELEEELGVAPADVAVLGTLDDYPTRSGYRITPVVMWVVLSKPLRPNAAEVASVHRIPVADLVHPDAVSFIAIPESDRRVVRLRVAGHQIHAPTAAMLYQFAELLSGRHTRVAELEQPVFAWR